MNRMLKKTWLVTLIFQFFTLVTKLVKHISLSYITHLDSIIVAGYKKLAIGHTIIH
jgi:hypothetical protein